jgi:hypothetical protein
VNRSQPEPSSLAKMRRLLLCLLVAPSAALLALAVGCSVSAPPSPEITGGSVVRPPPDAGSADAVAVVEAGEAAAPPIPGNRLCMPGGACDPDTATPASLCGVAPDGGVYDPSYADAYAGLACRVLPAQSVATDGIGSNVACSVAGTGMDGAACSSPSDCAARFECVGTPGVCRHYCCDGNTACTDKQFCDIQQLALATTTRVPVCMPIMHMGCALLDGDGGGCPAGETCTIVREDGATGCVEIGSKKPGEDCDTDHCIAGDVCLGSASAAPNTPGARTCYALCSMTGASSCGASTTCQGGLPLFQDPSVGVCR